jgi:hypothetical protein
MKRNYIMFMRYEANYVLTEDMKRNYVMFMRYEANYVLTRYET